MAAVKSNIPIIVGHLKALQGETDNILDAALNDASQALLGHITANWPIDTGLSLSKWEIKKVGQLKYVLANPVDYTSWVWTQGHLGGPTPLWERLSEEAIDAINADVTDFISDRVLALIDR